MEIRSRMRRVSQGVASSCVVGLALIWLAGTQLEHGTLTTPAFAAFAKDVVPFLHVTSNLRGRKHDNLLRTLVAHPIEPHPRCR